MAPLFFAAIAGLAGALVVGLLATEELTQKQSQEDFDAIKALRDYAYSAIMTHNWPAYDTALKALKTRKWNVYALSAAKQAIEYLEDIESQYPFYPQE